MKAAFLVRCSTDKQDYDRQLKDLNKVVEQFNFELDKDNIFGQYVTGRDDTTKGDRESIVKLRQGAERKDFDVILVNEVSRMSRDSVSGRVYIRQFLNLDIPIYFRDKDKWTIDINTRIPDTSFEKELGLYFDGAAEYLKSMKTQTASGRRKRLEDNQMVQGQPAYGYTKQGGNNKKTRNTVVINPDTFQIVIDTYNKYLEEGGTLKSTALAMSTKYKISFSVGKINHILNYSGYYSGQTTVNVVDPDRKELKAEPYIITFDSIIKEDLFTAVRTKLTGNRASTVPHNAKQKVHLLSRLIKCSFCGHSFTPRKRNDNRTAHNWLCMSRINNSCECGSYINLNDEKMNDIIWNFIKKEMLEYASVNSEERQSRIEVENDNKSRCEAEIADLNNNTESYKKKQNRAYTAYMSAPDGTESEALDRYNSTLVETKKEIDYITGRISILKQNIEESSYKISRYSQTDYTDTYIADIEANFDKKRSVFIENIKAIYPYKVAYRIVILEVHTIDGVYNILLNGNQRNYKEAYYINSIFSTWQNSNSKIKAYDSGDYFLVTNPSLVMESTELEEMVTFDEMIEICKMNDWTLKY